MAGLLEPFLLKARQEQGKAWLRGRILDYGCGGAETIKLMPIGCEYVGLDVDHKLLHELQKKYPQHMFITPQELTRYPPNSFDTIWMYSVFEHFNDEQPVLKLCHRVLKPSGYLVIVTVVPASEFPLKIMAALGLTRGEWLEEHTAYYTKRGLYASLKLAGFQVQHYHTFEFGLNQFVVAHK